MGTIIALDILMHCCISHVVASSKSFAAIGSDGRLVTWGDPQCGGDSSAVQAHLSDIEELAACSSAFAALLGDGRIVGWGSPDCGGARLDPLDVAMSVSSLQEEMRGAP